VIFAGDIFLADLNEETRRHVLVVSNDRFHRASGRVMVAPQVTGKSADSPFPWRVAIDDRTYAIDFVRSIDAARLLERIDRAPAVAMAAVRRTLRHIT
jgi:mRNA-degrading endonuclease toxin of MazEF toxin-antitoxin module